MTLAKTLYEKLFSSHVIVEHQQMSLLYIDRHLLHEVTSPQPFASLKTKGRQVRQVSKTFATMDHNISTKSLDISACSDQAQIQLTALVDNCKTFSIPLYGLGHEKQGIVHVMGPEQGLTLPGMTLVCGDSHTSTHGAFGALAFGIGTSEVEQVLTTQTLLQPRAKTMNIQVSGTLPSGVYAKDLALAIIAQIGHDGATGHIIEFSGDTISQLTMEGRMTLCNMAIEMGAKSGLIAPDETTFDYLAQRPFAPAGQYWQQALDDWKQLYSDKDALFDRYHYLNVEQLLPQITWGTNPGQVIDITQTIPDLASFANSEQRQTAEQALHYMGLKPGMAWQAIKLDKVFIGSCTNSRIEDLRIAASIVKHHRVAPHIQAIVVPGSMSVKRQAEAEGLDQLFIQAGFEWRLPGCSMCLAMNDDRLKPQERCAATSNRNFEGRQGRSGRTHLVSPAMAAAAAIAGHFTDCRQFLPAGS